jgi:hypothetical protein
MVQQAEKRGIPSCQGWTSSELYHAIRVWEESDCTHKLLESECRARDVEHSVRDDDGQLVKLLKEYDDRKEKTQPECVPRPKRPRREQPDAEATDGDDDRDSDASSDIS